MKEETQIATIPSKGYLTKTSKYKKSNYLISSKYKSTLLENKILNYAICNLDRSFEDKEGSVIVQMDVAELKKYLKITGNGLYQQLEKASQLMTGRVIGFSDPEEKTFAYIPLVTKAEYKGGKFSLRFAPEIRNQLLDLKSQYTLLDINTISSFSSVYGLRLYEILKSKAYVPKGVSLTEDDVFNIEMSLAELKIEMGAINVEFQSVKRILVESGRKGEPDYEKAAESAKEQMFRDWSHFKARCLDAAIADINDKTTMRVEYTLDKNGVGGKVRRINFKVRFGEEECRSLKETEPLTEINEDELLDRISDIIEEKIKISELKTIASTAGYDIGKIEKAYKVCKQQKEYKISFMATMIWAIQEDIEPNGEIPKSEKTKDKKKPAIASFATFTQREYDFEQLEKEIIAN